MKSLFDLKELNTAIDQYGWLRTLLLLAILILATGFCAWLVGSNQTIANTNTTDSQSTALNANILSASASDAWKSVSNSSSQNSERCVESNFDETLNEWDFREYNGPDSNGFYCPRITSGFSSPDIWRKQSIPFDTRSIKITFQTKDTGFSDGTNLPFIFSMGDVPRIFRIYVGENSPQLVGFEKISIDSTSGDLERENPENLRDPIKSNTQTELTVKPVIIHGNNAKVIFNISYISAETDDLVEDDFSYDLKLPFPQPEDSTIKFGIGTLKGVCIKPIHYQICQ